MTSNAMGPNSPLLPRSADDPLDRPHTTGSTDYEPSSITVSHSTAKWLVPASMAFNVGMQIYGMRSSPNMKVKSFSYCVLDRLAQSWETFVCAY